MKKEYYKSSLCVLGAENIEEACESLTPDEAEHYEYIEQDYAVASFYNAESAHVFQKILIANVEEGILNEFQDHYPNVVIFSTEWGNGVNNFAEHLPEELLDSPELWFGKFRFNGKKYLIAGDGELTGSGQYVVAEIEE